MTVTAGPYEAKVPRTDFTAVEELAAALEGQAPMLARSVAAALGPLVTVNLARAIRRAVAAGINRDARRRDPQHLAGLYELLVQGLDQVTDGNPPECVAIEGVCDCGGFDPHADEPWVPVVCGNCGHESTWHTRNGCAYVFEEDEDRGW